MEEIFNNLMSKEPNLMILILESQSISSTFEKQGPNFSIRVDEKGREKAFQAINTYHKENPFTQLKKNTKLSCLFIQVLDCLFDHGCLLIHPFRGRSIWCQRRTVLNLGSSALYILQGEIFRTITALFLHADGQHLLRNISGMIVFGTPLINLTGFGTGPIFLLISATLGNYLNAIFYKTDHLSIGASTAIIRA
jgi:rhomboid protease GluP